MVMTDTKAFKIPADGIEIFQIGDFLFDIVEDQSKWEISALSNELQTRIVAKTQEVKRAIKSKLLDDDVEGNVATVHIDFPGIGVYSAGMPNGGFVINEDKCELTYSYVRKEGFEYRLDFFGTVTFEGGWLGYEGYLKPPYESKPVFTVKIYKKFEVDTLNWSNYKFTSYEETLTAPAELVRFLNLKNPDFEEVPERLLSFNNLQELVISCQWPLDKLGLKSLPDKIGELHLLEQIAINGTQIEVLPESIGQLSNLKAFYFNNGRLRTVPASLFQLSRLTSLMLSNQQLKTLPQSVKLPALKSLDLSGNQLQTIPASLLQQENLNSIDLQNNPLKSLPSEINNIKNVSLSIEDKKRLMDFDYNGADGRGLLVWDDAIFNAMDDIILSAQMSSIFHANHVTIYQDALRSLAKRSVAFKLTGDEDYASIGNHRFGGMPDLPADVNYPTFMEKIDGGEREYSYEFIAQINCEDIANLQDYLPRKGILFFFLETIHHIYTRSLYNPCKVIYVENIASLETGKRFNLYTEDYYEMYEAGYSASKAEAFKELSFPSFYASDINQYLFKGEAAVMKDEKGFEDGLFEDITDTGAGDRGYQHAINAYGFTQHESPELQASLKLKGNPEDWIILLKVSSSGDFQWGDAGDLFFVIHKSDLMKNDFSNVFVTLESS